LGVYVQNLCQVEPTYFDVARESAIGGCVLWILSCVAIHPNC
jgi:hypothetical protein